MTANAPCKRTDGPELAERYVTRRLTPDESAAFEDHFISCTDCHDAVRFAVAVHAAVRTNKSDCHPNSAPETRRRAPRRFAAGIGIGVALAAGIGAIIVLRSTPTAALASLGNVLEPPLYLGVAVRGAPGGADSIFQRAMTAYSARDYAGSVAGLRATLAAGQDSVPAEFFLGASLLMSNHTREAAEAFARLITKGDTPYRDDAQLLQAKALLRLGRAREAIEVLAQHTPTDPVLAGAISALSDSVTRALAR